MAPESDSPLRYYTYLRVARFMFYVMLCYIMCMYMYIYIYIYIFFSCCESLKPSLRLRKIARRLRWNPRSSEKQHRSILIMITIRIRIRITIMILLLLLLQQLQQQQLLLLLLLLTIITIIIITYVLPPLPREVDTRSAHKASFACARQRSRRIGDGRNNNHHNNDNKSITIIDI